MPMAYWPHFHGNPYGRVWVPSLPRGSGRRCVMLCSVFFAFALELALSLPGVRGRCVSSSSVFWSFVVGCWWFWLVVGRTRWRSGWFVNALVRPSLWRRDIFITYQPVRGHRCASSVVVALVRGGCVVGLPGCGDAGSPNNLPLTFKRLESYSDSNS